MQPRTRKLSRLIVAALFPVLTFAGSGRAEASQVSLKIQVIYAHNDSDRVDPKLVELAKTKPFSKLKFTAYELKSEVPLRLGIGAAGSVELPNKRWMKVRATKMMPDGNVRIEFSVDKPEFRATAVISPGSTLAVGGPKYGAGSLILAVERPKG
jgi:hypothetical protein